MFNIFLHSCSAIAVIALEFVATASYAVDTPVDTLADIIIDIVAGSGVGVLNGVNGVAAMGTAVEFGLPPPSTESMFSR